ncbi:palmitoyltransferase ZDHHC6 isoform X1 [Tribolium madens]|uniref:palmitoyltransferase ZDHHC6 isoform X1 n=2 Tax=Tribolium madens TaxID=41895 RepID=UPI001CF76649|nr:palmitoyltransferase ZDHHC6 isoform X1 [Tribolium madens]XP_044260017.1 palmitoyltransferase ZDHHC6 isoform X1 [Tribolium madens]
MCYGPFARICHWGPLTALGIIKLVTGMTIHCSGMWWPPARSLGGFLNSLVFISCSGFTLYNFLSSMYHGPGYLPQNWKPVNEGDCEYLQWCGVCQGYKAPRSHHCRKCGRCVLKMDHHCPWINNCVGWGNHAHFASFLAFATLGCLHASIILGCSLFRALNRVHYLYYGSGKEPIVHLGLYGIILCVLALGFTIGVVIAVGMLLFFQIRAILRNRTGIEDWIMEKANYRRKSRNEKFIFPYDLGVWQNIRQVVNFSCQPIGDGIFWPVVDSCDQFTLTREQIEQKTEKRQRTKLYKIIHPASGSWVPITQGLKVCCCPPCTDEARIKLELGDTVSVTRWRKYWLFGEKIQDLPQDEESLCRIRGWFPRRCAVEVIDGSEQSVKDKKIK